MRLQDKVTLITGGAAGIGKATAERFAAEGAVVVICDLNEAAGQELVQTLGPKACYYKVNVADRQAVQAWVDEVVAKFGRIDVLVNNAGIVRDSQLVKLKDGEVVKMMSEADFDLVIAVNLKGTFNCTQAVAPVMMRQKSGVILNASSVVGLDGNFGQTNYVATKAGVIGLTKVWARDAGQVQRARQRPGPRFHRHRHHFGHAGKGVGRDARENSPEPPGPARRHRQCIPVPGLRRSQLHLRCRAAGGRRTGRGHLIFRGCEKT